MVSDVDIFKAIRLIALRDVLLDCNFSAKVLSYYSTTFHTPLHEAEKLQFEHVLYYYFFDKYQKATQDENFDKHYLIEEVLKTEDDQDQESKDKDRESVEMDELEKEIIEEERAKDKADKPLDVLPKVTINNKDEVKLPSSESEKLSMQFVSDDEMERLANMTPEEAAREMGLGLK